MIKKKKQAEIEVVRTKDVHVGMEYPYLPSEWDWEIHNIPFAQLPKAKPNPTLRLVKDNKVIDIHVPDMSTTDFLSHWGLRPSMRRGGYILCKRFSRLMHPYRYWTFLNPHEVKIVHRDDWDADLWDGCGRMSKKFIRTHLLPRLSDLPEQQRRKYERELLHTGRFEITVMHEGGQEKGDCIVYDSLPDGAARFACSRQVVPNQSLRKRGKSLSGSPPLVILKMECALIRKASSICTRFLWTTEPVSRPKSC